MKPDIFARRETDFVLWRALPGAHPPELIIGRLQLGTPVAFVDERRVALSQAQGLPDLWFIPATDCHLVDGEIYHYWFEVTDSHPQRTGERIKITDPMASTIDWRLLAQQPEGPGYGDDDRYPASVVKFNEGRLVAVDPGGEINPLSGEAPLPTLAPNSRLVIYELPTAWTRIGSAGEREIGIGTFRDVASLVDPGEGGANFSDLGVTQPGRSYFAELGVNALELLPPADSFYDRQWGYGTTNFFAPDFDLGLPEDYTWPASNRDLGALVATCHARGIRFFVDVVMAFARTNAYLAAATTDFFILDPRSNPTDPDAHNSRGKDDENFRNGFGSSLFRYAAFVNGYDPISGQQMNLSPARQLMKASLLRWMNDFHIDGIRMDSVENISNWDFIQEYKDLARQVWREKFADHSSDSADERFLIVGEELNEPLELLRQRRLDGLWHEQFKRYIRAALLGKPAEGESSFETTVRKAIDCRSFGYEDLTQAVIYLTSHDVERFGNERLFNFLRNNNASDIEKRIRLAFACLLTAVGVPMILAGDEFADQHDLFDEHGNVSQEGGKQVDPVNFSRLNDEWRQSIKEYVARLIKFRTTSDALAMNDTRFIHVDIQDGKRVLAWLRGQPGSEKVAVVLANFSDFGTADPFNPAAEYRVNNWPAAPAGKRWREITQERDVPLERIGREPIFPWEAKIYTLV